MRKVSLILAVLLFAVPAWARVDIICEQTDTNEVTVSYVMDSEPNKVRAFALDITLDNDANILSVDDSVNDWYDIYPGSIVIDDGEIDDEGQAVADPNDHTDTQPGLDSNGITIEMGGLWSPPNDDDNAPPLTDVLLKFYVDKSCYVTITQNNARGGVVLTDPTQVTDYNAPGVEPVPPYYVDVPPPDCLIGGNAGTSEYNDWDTWGKPNCWCYCRQCRGDVNGKRTLGKWVQGQDLTIFRNAFLLSDGDLEGVTDGICADLNHKKTLGKRVQGQDLTILRKYFLDADADIPSCDQADPANGYAAPYTGPYNFWCDPTGCPAECPQY